MATGTYRVRWWSQHHKDKLERSFSDCRFWSTIHYIKSNGKTGRPQPVNPKKVKRYHWTGGPELANPKKIQPMYTNLRLRWLTDDISLAEHAIVGPFDFVKLHVAKQGLKRRVIRENYHIDEVYWKELTKRSQEFDIDLGPLFQKPLASMPTQV